MKFSDIEKIGIRRTIISFDPFLFREDVSGLPDYQVAKKFGLETKTVKAMRRHEEVPFDTIRQLCHVLECQPGDILKATTAYLIPAKESNPDA